MLYVTIILCSLGAATQSVLLPSILYFIFKTSNFFWSFYRGWDQTGSNGASESIHYTLVPMLKNANI